MTSPEPIPTFLFDGDCAFCSSCARWIERHLPRQPRVLAWQFADLAPLEVTAEQCTEAVQWIRTVDEPARIERASGADAVAQLLIYQPGPWRLLGRAMLLPGVVQVAGLVYRWIARHRDRMPGGTPACAVPESQHSAGSTE